MLLSKPIIAVERKNGWPVTGEPEKYLEGNQQNYPGGTLIVTIVPGALCCAIPGRSRANSAPSCIPVVVNGKDVTHP
jgi:hypothetical protein